jgi:hypothetical protein
VEEDVGRRGQPCPCLLLLPSVTHSLSFFHRWKTHSEERRVCGWGVCLCLHRGRKERTIGGKTQDDNRNSIMYITYIYIYICNIIELLGGYKVNGPYKPVVVYC